MNLHSRFLSAADAWPDQVAVDADDGTLTYAALASRAAAVASALVAAGGGHGDRVGLLVDHGLRPVVAVMGALAAGRCYVPLDPTWPAARLAHMCSHAEVSAVLTTPEHHTLATTLTSAPVITLPEPTSEPPAAAAPVAVGSVGGGEPAYILYTSGSTGVPKGVVQSHRNVLHGVANHVRNLAITPEDRVSLLTSFSFDMAVTDLFSALLTGATVVPVDVRRHGLGHLVAALAGRGVTVYHSTPTVYRYLVDALRSAATTLPDLRVAVLGGEEVFGADVRAARELFAENCVLVNGYGATEVSFAVQNHVRPGMPARDGVLPIGHELDGYEVRLSGGDHGEISVHSEYLALGYWRDEERTAERFVDGGRTYLTGDLGSRLPDGRLVYRGRADRQVKLRGYRVELGEVEAHLEALPSVARAVAVVHGESLVGYLQPAIGAAPDLDAVRSALAETVPDYLVPGVLVRCDELPLTPTGKVDVRALPAPGPAVDPTDRPATAAERTVHDAWCAVLGLPAVGVTVNFFDLGGHSLLLARVQQKLEAEAGARLSLVSLLANPTVRAQAARLTAGATGGDALDAVARRMARRADRRPAGPRPRGTNRNQEDTP
jgi:phthiocerol/phenolphthiocerol synthesis type-I polyketide synthase E